MDSSITIGELPEVLHFNRLFPNSSGSSITNLEAGSPHSSNGISLDIHFYLHIYDCLAGQLAPLFLFTLMCNSIVTSMHKIWVLIRVCVQTIRCMTLMVSHLPIPVLVLNAYLHIYHCYCVRFPPINCSFNSNSPSLLAQKMIPLE